MLFAINNPNSVPLFEYCVANFVTILLQYVRIYVLTTALYTHDNVPHIIVFYW